MSDAMHSSSSQGSSPISQSVERLRREFERWVEAALQQGGRALDVVGLRATDRQWAPAVDLVETPTDLHIDVDLPGVEPSVVDVSLAGNMLTVQGPKKIDTDSGRCRLASGGTNARTVSSSDSHAGPRDAR
jgi:HSP20 family molecular chaperone IbpA